MWSESVWAWADVVWRSSLLSGLRVQPERTRGFMKMAGDIWKHEDSCETEESVSVISTGNLIQAKLSLNCEQKQLVSMDRLVLVSSSSSVVCFTPEDPASQRLWSGVRMFQSSCSEAWQHKRLHVSKHQQEMSGSESEQRITRRLLSFQTHHFHGVQQSYKERSVPGAAEITAHTDRRLQRPECKANTRHDAFRRGLQLFISAARSIRSNTTAPLERKKRKFRESTFHFFNFSVAITLTLHLTSWEEGN